MRFVELDYIAFLKLLYDADWLAAAQHQGKEIKIAKAIIHFPLQRQKLYRRLINESVEEEVATLVCNRDATGAGISCVVAEILGQTTGQTMKPVHGIKIFIDMPGI